MNPKELHEAHGELAALLRAGQAPAIALLLRARFLAASAALGHAAWSAYGYPVARDFLRAFGDAGRQDLPQGVLDEASALLEDLAARTPPPRAPNAGWREEIAVARRAIGAARERRAGVGSGLDRGADAGGDPPGDPAEARVLIPVVAAVRGGEKARPLFRSLACGMVVPISVRVEGMLRVARGSEPAVVRGVPGPREREMAALLGGLEDLGIRGAPSLRQCLFRFGWDESSAALEGRSGELGFFLAAASAYSSLAVGGSPRRIRSGVACTGVVGPGRVEEVDATTLIHKVNACVHAGLELLVVPESQSETAVRLALASGGSRPGPRLRVRGAATPAGAWRDPEVTEPVRRGLARTAAVAARRAAMSPTLVVLSGLVVLLLAYLAATGWLGSRNFPVAAAWDGDRIVARNDHGNVTAVLEEGLARPDVVDNPTYDRIGKRLAVWDLNGDGINEVLAMYRGRETRTVRFAAFDREGKRLWDLASDSLAFPVGEPNDEMMWVAFYSSDVRIDGSLQMIALRRVPPRATAMADWIDGATGRPAAHFANEGHIEALFPVDLDGNGYAEHCLSATDNRTRSGLLAVLRIDPEGRSVVPSGSGPLPPIRSLSDPEQVGREIVAVFRFPLDRYSHTRAHAREVSQDGPGTIRVCVVGAGEGSIAERCVQYFLDLSDPNEPLLRDVQFTDAYRAIVLRTHAGVGGEEIGAEAERLAAGVLRLGPGGWVPVPRPTS
ncbi:MAG: hypothetical protein EHM19_08685 [Candidatus Latescibacterota bacterium]|nr:MAG: hypothetical protein EHM19_08685 [Candidatus Latescibacterota bacterium]